MFKRNFTKCIIGLKNYEYEERLRALNIPSLEYRRIRGDLIETFKIFNNLYDPSTTKPLINLSPVYTNITRSNSLKIFKKRFNLNTYKYFFSNRVVNIWNNLSSDTVLTNNLNLFKNKVDSELSHLKFKTKLDIYNLT